MGIYLYAATYVHIVILTLCLNRILNNTMHIINNRIVGAVGIIILLYCNPEQTRIFIDYIFA